MFGKRRADKLHYTNFEKAFDKVPHKLLLQKKSKLYKVDPSNIL